MQRWTGPFRIRRLPRTSPSGRLPTRSRDFAAAVGTATPASPAEGPGHSLKGGLGSGPEALHDHQRPFAGPVLRAARRAAEDRRETVVGRSAKTRVHPPSRHRAPQGALEVVPQFVRLAPVAHIDRLLTPAAAVGASGQWSGQAAGIETPAASIPLATNQARCDAPHFTCHPKAPAVAAAVPPLAGSCHIHNRS